MKIDFEKLERNTGISKISKSDLLDYIKSILYNLKTHNKNYTKDQENRIDLLYDIFECIE